MFASALSRAFARFQDALENTRHFFIRRATPKVRRLTNNPRKNRESQKRNKNQPILPTSVKPNVSARTSSVSALAIVPVRVKAKGGSAFVETHAFLDSGSNTSLLTETLLKLLNVTGNTTNLSLTLCWAHFEISAQKIFFPQNVLQMQYNNNVK